MGGTLRKCSHVSAEVEVSSRVMMRSAVNGVASQSSFVESVKAERRDAVRCGAMQCFAARFCECQHCLENEVGRQAGGGGD